MTSNVPFICHAMFYRSNASTCHDGNEPIRGQGNNKGIVKIIYVLCSSTKNIFIQRPRIHGIHEHNT